MGKKEKVGGAGGGGVEERVGVYGGLGQIGRAHV